MIWSSTRDGAITYAGPEWFGFTGQSVADALGDGWLRMLHPDDRDETRAFFRKACASAAPFTVLYRIARKEGGFSTVVAGAAPALSPLDGSFLGYLGALSELDETLKISKPVNFIGRSTLHPSTAKTLPLTPIDIVADHLLLARAIAEGAGEQRLLASLDFAITEVMRRLGYAGASGDSH